MSTDVFAQFEELVAQLNVMKNHLAHVQQQTKQLEKTVRKQLKESKKAAAKLKVDRAPSGFARPSDVTKELCAFLNIPEGTTIARTDVTRAIIAYIKKNHLESKDNKKLILPDEKLRTLLCIEEGEHLTYFTLQKYMSKHFVKKGKS
jgi:chromatin remodeling complex protein RSC6